MLYAEYLLLYENSNGICDDKNTLLALISTNSNFHVKDDKISFNKVEYNITIKRQNPQELNDVVFYVKIETTSNIDLEDFYKMLSILKKTLGSLFKNNILCTWNGVAYEWAKELYSEIFEVENLFRKVITQLMLCTVGKNWTKDTIPQEAKDSIHEKDYPLIQTLYYTDFISLSYFLFKTYAKKGIDKITELKQILDKDPIDTILLKSLLEDYIPQNNWERYFKGKIKIESSSLQKEVQQLYNIRCSIAHNRFIDIDEYKNGLTLCKSLKETFKEAINQAEKNEIFDSLSSEEIDELRETLNPNLEEYNKYKETFTPHNENNRFAYSSRNTNNIQASLGFISNTIAINDLNKCANILSNTSRDTSKLITIPTTITAFNNTSNGLIGTLTPNTLTLGNNFTELTKLRFENGLEKSPLSSLGINFIANPLNMQPKEESNHDKTIKTKSPNTDKMENDTTK